MKARKLTDAEFKRSLSAKVDHVWIYNKNINSKKPAAWFHDSVSCNWWKGRPQLCVVIDRDHYPQDDELSKIFGEGSFINGAVSPSDKENMDFDSYYIFKN